MPIPRKYATTAENEIFDWSERFVDLVKTEVKKVHFPLPSAGWIKTISTVFEIDKEFSESIFKRLIDDGLLIFLARSKGHNMYISSYAPLENQIS